ncbi:alkaline phosphatase family protein [Natrinema halophilum]|uniref:Alkaline phosphatase family protein n=1 Tax=Natrinema halophilum TaxID=1699371 RepID=A0A7D5KR06_9EURY|nr:alkaline phosphatase family protein [Natrinema halophilum]QLG48857.1 alkaline phosphatase family protein [Natrinema halophilum]
MTTLGIVALDAADYALAREWDCQNMLLETHRELETFAHSGKHPNTLEVWTATATGVGPTEHGLESTGEQQQWRNPVLEYASTVTPYILPKDVRIRLGTWLRGDSDGDGDVGMTLRQTSHSHLFQPDGHVVRWWPGVTPGEHLSETWHWLNLASSGEITDDELWRRLYGNAGLEAGWLQGMGQTTVAVAGVHMHVLDAAGHAFATRLDRLREVYERVDRLLGSVREQVDELLVLSDHGMQVEWIDGDTEPGFHSWRALASTTLADDPPESVFGVREWVEARVDAGDVGDGSGNERRPAVMDTTEEQLRDLGYLE